jgi:hypothetical protein
MPLIERIIDQYLRLTERSQIARAIVYGLTAFVVIYGIERFSYFFSRMGGFEEQLADDILEAVVLAIIATRLSQLREERVLRRHRQVQYLNHHVRNALALIAAVEHQLETTKAHAVHRATNRICAVVEQLSRDEDVCIDDKEPGKYTKAA